MYDIDVILADVHRYLSSAGLSERGTENYDRFLRRFFDWFRATYPDAEPDQVDGSVIMEWFAQNPHWAPATKYMALAALRGFYRFNYRADHPVTRVKIRRIEAGPQRTLEQDELQSLLLAIDTTTPRGVRDLAIVTLMADTKMRSSEVCNLELRNLDVRKGRLIALAKGGIWSEKVFAEYTASCLDNWLAIRPDYAIKWAKTVFVGIGGKTPGQPMTKSGLRVLYEHLARDAGLPHVTPHTMRRTFATLATEHGAPTRLVQVAGGWKSIRMVEHYTRTLKPDTIRRFSPVNNIMGLTEHEV